MAQDGRNTGHRLEHLNPRIIWWAIGTGAVVVAVVLAVLVPIAISTDPNQAGVWVDIITRSLAIFAGVGGGFALWLAFRRQQAVEEQARENERHLHELERDAIERRIAELRIQAVAQLGSEKAPVRIGGLHNLERLAQEHEDLRQLVINELCAYLRMPPPTELDEQERQVRLTAQAILARHFRRGGEYWVHNVANLSGAVLEDLDFRDCELYDAHFTGATFNGVTSFADSSFHGAARFEKATFHSVVWFTDVSFDGKAVFDNAKFHSTARFTKAAFHSTGSFVVATFRSIAVFQGAEFHATAGFVKAIFCGTIRLDNVTFHGGARFVTADFQRGVELTGCLATLDDDHDPYRWPDGWRIEPDGSRPGFGRLTLLDNGLGPGM